MKPYVTFIDNTILEGATPWQKLPEGWTRAPSLVETPLAPIPKEVKDTWVEKLGVPPISWEADELDAAEKSTDELAFLMATAEEPTDEPAILTATVWEPAEEPDTLPIQWEVGEKRKVPSSNYPGWTEVLHPTQPATPAGWTPPTLGELRWHHHSQSLGGRMAQCQWDEECRMATEG